ncbi:MAG TPA: rod-binding protein [Verrucomicrobiae bacterium]|jgi:flagellar protein FlgJ|nr:rod-binding protein [Verrucomicrobiae bacterium]
MNVSPLQSRVDAKDIPIEKLAANSSISDSEKVGQACRQFEAIFLREIFKDMRKTVISSSMHKDTAVSGIYDDMVNNQLADSVSRSGAFGLAKSLEKQLSRQTLGVDKDLNNDGKDELTPLGASTVATRAPYVAGVHANAVNSQISKPR